MLTLPGELRLTPIEDEAERNAEDSLLENGQRFRLLFEQSPTGGAIVEARTGKLCELNRRFAEILGRSREELIGAGWMRFAHPEDRTDPLADKVRLLEAVTETLRFDRRYLRPDGSAVWVHVTLAPAEPSAGPDCSLAMWIEDISERKKADEELVRSRAELERAQSIAHVGSWWLDVASQKAEWSRETYQIFGIEPGSTITHEMFLSLVHPDDLRGVEAGWEAVSARASSYEHSFRIFVGGQLKWIHNRLEFEYDEQGRLKFMFGTKQDITALKRAEEVLRESEERLRLAAEAARFGIFEYDLEAGTSYWSGETRSILGLSADAPATPPGRVPDCVHPDDVIMLRRSHVRAMDPAGDGVVENTHRIIRPDGSLRWIEQSGRVRFIGQGAQRRPVRVHGVIVDVTERRQAREHIEFLALHDAMTGLPNRESGQDRLRQEVDMARRTGSRLAVLNLDLDNFKFVNDTHGHAVGDRLLRSVAGRLGACLRAADTLCRLSGDEFMIVLPELCSQDQVSEACEKILASLAEPFELEGIQLMTSFSIGIALYPQDGGDSETLLRNADMALYEAKRGGRNTHRFFEAEMNASLMRYVQVRNDLRLALERDEFVLHYQPQIELGSGRLVGVEALLRWNRPGHGLTMPGEFIGVAEDSGLIVPIGRWVLRHACRQAAVWHAAGWDHIVMSVNLSTVQFRQGQLERDVQAALDDSGLDPALLELELTESSLLQHDGGVMAALGRLNGRGIRLAIDDFGTGYSNLAYLKRFNVDKLKIDRSFVCDLDHDEEDQAIVCAIVQIARSLGIKTIAEGVESTELASRLRAMGCDEVQGHLYAVPMPAADLTRWISAYQV